MWGLVVAAGSGRRFGGEKQFLSLAGKPVHRWAVEATRSVAVGVVLVVPPGREQDANLEGGADIVVAGGDTRSASVRAGLQAVPESAGIIVVHDAARPIASEALFRAVVAAVEAGADAAIPGVPLVDTVKTVEGCIVSSTVDRSNLVRVQTPQAFRSTTLRQAHASGPEGTDDSAAVEAIGAQVVVVLGEEANVKITSPSDLSLLEWRLSCDVSALDVQ
ncbi:MAG: 2-C-methyl-D-erythritol 4-phosphate cytidylyltransferase [Acidimicrobiales bacterium]